MTTRTMFAALALVVAAARSEAGSHESVAKGVIDAARNAAGKEQAHVARVEASVQQAIAGAAGQPVQASSAKAATPAVTPSVKTAAPVVEDTAPADSESVPARAEEMLGGEEVTAGKQPLRENSYFYGSFGTTDPFRSLLAGDFEPKLQELVDVHTVQLVGVIWEPDDIAAMVQDAQGFGYTLRPGDAIKNGTVVAVKQDALVARLTVFGQTTQVTLHLQRDDEE
jgi:hypothetical protein